jgi:hypothetical protein
MYIDNLDAYSFEDDSNDNDESEMNVYTLEDLLDETE